jgi:hypothetical protein
VRSNLDLRTENLGDCERVSTFVGWKNKVQTIEVLPQAMSYKIIVKHISAAYITIILQAMLNANILASRRNSLN